MFVILKTDYFQQKGLEKFYSNENIMPYLHGRSLENTLTISLSFTHYFNFKNVKTGNNSILHLNFWISNLLTDELGHPIPSFNDELGAAVVKHDDPDVPAVILVHDSSSNINMILPGQPRPGSYTTIGAVGDFYLNNRNSNICLSGLFYSNILF